MLSSHLGNLRTLWYQSSVDKLKQHVYFQSRKKTSKDNHTPRKSRGTPNPSVSKIRHSETPEVMSQSRATTALCNTPDSLKSSRVGALYSPTIESFVKTKKKKKNSVSSLAESAITNRSRRFSLVSESEVLIEDATEHDVSNNNSDNIYYVKLAALTEKGVFVSTCTEYWLFGRCFRISLCFLNSFTASSIA